MGAPISFQSGKSSFKAVGSMQAPDMVCLPVGAGRGAWLKRRRELGVEFKVWGKGVGDELGL